MSGSFEIVKGLIKSNREKQAKLKKSLSRKKKSNSNLKAKLARSRKGTKVLRERRTRRITSPKMNELKTKSCFWCPLRRSRSWIYKHGDKNGKYLSYDGLRKNEIERVKVGNSFRYKNKQARNASFLRLKKAAASKGLSVKDYMARLRSSRKKSKTVSKTVSKAMVAVPRRSARLQKMKL